MTRALCTLDRNSTADDWASSATWDTLRYLETFTVAQQQDLWRIYNLLEQQLEVRQHLLTSAMAKICKCQQLNLYFWTYISVTDAAPGCHSPCPLPWSMLQAHPPIHFPLFVSCSSWTLLSAHKSQKKALFSFISSGFWNCKAFTESLIRKTVEMCSWQGKCNDQQWGCHGNIASG